MKKMFIFLAMLPLAACCLARSLHGPYTYGGEFYVQYIMTPNPGNGVYFVCKYAPPAPKYVWIYWGSVSTTGVVSYIGTSGMLSRGINPVGLTLSGSNLYLLTSDSTGLHVCQLGSGSMGPNLWSSSYTVGGSGSPSITSSNDGGVYVSYPISTGTAVEQAVLGTDAFTPPHTMNVLTSPAGGFAVAVSGTSDVVGTFGYGTTTAGYDTWGNSPTYFSASGWLFNDGTQGLADPATGTALGQTMLFASYTATGPGLTAQPGLAAILPGSPLVPNMSMGASGTNPFPPSGYTGMPATYHENAYSFAVAPNNGGSYRICGTCDGPYYDWNVYEATYSTSTGWSTIGNVGFVGLTGATCAIAAADKDYDYFISNNGTNVLYQVTPGGLPGSASSPTSPNVFGTTLPIAPTQAIAIQDTSSPNTDSVIMQDGGGNFYVWN